MLVKLAQRFGLLRTLLVLSTVVLAAVSPFALKAGSIEESGLFLPAIAPSLVVILIFVIPLDMAMTRIFMSAANDENRARLSFVIKSEGVLLLLLLATWIPFFSTLLIREP